MKKVLVTDGEQRSSLAVVRSLGGAGYDVRVCSAHDRPLAGASRYCTSTHRVHDPAEDPAGFLAAIETLVDEVGIEIVLPMTDISAPILFELRRTRPSVMVPFPDADKYHAVSDKAALSLEAQKLGVPVPQQRVVDAPSQAGPAALELAGEVGYPIVLKPARSVVERGGRPHKLTVEIADSALRLERLLNDYPPEAYPLLVQEHIDGPGLGVFLLFHEGRTLAAFGHERLREKPPTGGVSVYRESVPLRADVKAHAETLLRHFGWSGVAMVEFKEKATTGTPYLMEVNGRFWGSLQLAIDAGVDFPELLMRTMTGCTVAPVTRYRTGVRSRWLWGDLDHLIGVLRAPPETRAGHAGLPSRFTAIARFLIPWRPGDRWEVLRLSDPRPFFSESVSWFRSLRS